MNNVVIDQLNDTWIQHKSFLKEFFNRKNITLLSRFWYYFILGASHKKNNLNKDELMFSKNNFFTFLVNITEYGHIIWRYRYVIPTLSVLTPGSKTHFHFRIKNLTNWTIEIRNRNMIALFNLRSMFSFSLFHWNLLGKSVVEFAFPNESRCQDCIPM